MKKKKMLSDSSKKTAIVRLGQFLFSYIGELVKISIPNSPTSGSTRAVGKVLPQSPS